MFDKMKEGLQKKADELVAKADAIRTPVFYESEWIVAVQMVVGQVKQALNTVTDYKAKGFHVVGIVEQEAIHASLILMEKL